MDKTNFFGNEIKWRQFRDGLLEIQETHRPGIIVIEKTWCPTCKKVGALFQKDKELVELSNSFVMICCIDDEEPNFDDFRPDGSYYPRFFFVNGNGDMNYEITSGEEGKLYRYFYSSPEMFKIKMKEALELPVNKA